MRSIFFFFAGFIFTHLISRHSIISGLVIVMLEELKARFKRRTSHVPHLMQMRKIYCFPSFALDSAHVKFDVWTGPKARKRIDSMDSISLQHDLSRFRKRMRRKICPCSPFAWVELRQYPVVSWYDKPLCICLFRKKRLVIRKLPQSHSACFKTASVIILLAKSLNKKSLHVHQEDTHVVYNVR